MPNKLSRSYMDSKRVDLDIDTRKRGGKKEKKKEIDRPSRCGGVARIPFTSMRKEVMPRVFSL